MRINEHAILPDFETIRVSLRGMKAKAHLLRLEMLCASGVYLPNGKLIHKRDFNFKKRAVIARKVLKLERIIAQMELIKETIVCRVKKAA